MRVFGKNVLKELINEPNKIKKVYLKNNTDKDIFNLIKENKIRYEIVTNDILNRLANGNHQGIVIDIDDYKYSSFEDILESDKIIILDHLNDPHNFGAIIRTCEALGIKSIIIPKDRSVNVNETVIKVSSGAINYVNIYECTNLVQIINKLKDKNYFIYGTDMNGKDYYNTSYSSKLAIVIGNEGEGMSRLVKESCDEIITIPMVGKINSLNASVATAIVISRIVR